MSTPLDDKEQGEEAVLVDRTAVRELRRTKGMTREDLSQRSGLSVACIQKIEQGTTKRPRLGTVRLLAAAFDVDISQLTGHALNAVQLLTSNDDVVRWNMRIAQEAKQLLAVTGSRSHDKPYLEIIEQRLRENPDLVHYRIMFTRPLRQELHDHIQRLVSFRDPQDRSVNGNQTTHIGWFQDHAHQQEFCVCANESCALLVLPSMHGMGKYTTALVVRNKQIVKGWLQWIVELYQACSNKIEDIQAAKELGVANRKNLYA